MSSCKPLCAIFLRGVASLSQLAPETQRTAFVGEVEKEGCLRELQIGITDQRFKQQFGSFYPEICPFDFSTG